MAFCMLQKLRLDSFPFIYLGCFRTEGLKDSWRAAGPQLGIRKPDKLGASIRVMEGSCSDSSGVNALTSKDGRAGKITLLFPGVSISGLFCRKELPDQSFPSVNPPIKWPHRLTQSAVP